MDRKLKVLITAGNTACPIDQVRQITNIFKGRTGAQIAYDWSEVADVWLMTSNSDLLRVKSQGSRVRICDYRTYDELYEKMENNIKIQNFDVIVHSAAVSDYRVAGVFEMVTEDNLRGTEYLFPIDNSAKISSEHEELYLKLVKTPKIVDKIRDWGFNGVLVKFKLQVGIPDEELIQIATKSMKDSNANIIVANTIEGINSHAYVITEKDGFVQKVNRDDIGTAIWETTVLKELRKSCGYGDNCKCSKTAVPSPPILDIHPDDFKDFGESMGLFFRRD